MDVLYRLGQADRIVGISGFTVHPPEARKEKPKISAYTSAKIDKILALKPDLVLGFSDLQADIMADLVRLGLEVHVFNQRSIEGILGAILTLGRLLDCPDEARSLVMLLNERLASIRLAPHSAARPRVFFEEWNEPLMCGIQWVSELIEWVGGEDICAREARSASAKDRIIEPHVVVERNPHIIIGSWCGKKFRPDEVMTRAGFGHVEAVVHQRLHEIKSADILQPGPIALTQGADQLAKIIQAK